MTNLDDQLIFVAGSTGYIGGRLVSRLLKEGYHVRAVGRSMEKLHNRKWANHPHLETAQIDILDRGSVAQAASGCQAGYYLIPSADPFGPDYSEDIHAAENVAFAAERAKWEQIIFLGEIRRESDQLGRYLHSRRIIESLLGSGKTPLTSLRVALILGCGNAAFEIMRSLVHRLPVILTQGWMRTVCQPVALPDVITYLIACLNHAAKTNRIFDIGGPDRLTYQHLMEIYITEAGLKKRFFIPSPVPDNRLSAYWLHLQTPVLTSLAFMLAQRLRYRAVCQEEGIHRIVELDLLDARQSFRQIIDKLNNEAVETHWTDVGITPPANWLPESGTQGGDRKLYQDYRHTTIKASKGDVWKSLVRIDGRTGWYYGNGLWKLRGFLDRLVGGVGSSRGRRHPEELRPGDALDVWRARIVNPPSRLMLVAEMKLPGKAILDFQIKGTDSHHVRLEQTAWYDAHGFLGILYWYGVLPFHSFIFEGMIQGILKATRLSHRYSYETAVRIISARVDTIGELINISSGGCKIFSPKLIKEDATLRLFEDQPIQISTSVKLIDKYRVRDGYHLSMEFQNLSVNFKNWLRQIIKQLES